MANVCLSRLAVLAIFLSSHSFAQDEAAPADESKPTEEAKPDSSEKEATPESTEKKLEDLPLHLSATLDEFERRWDPLNMGAFVNGTRCFNGAMLLSYGDDEFEAEEVWEDTAKSTYRMKGKLNGLNVERRIMIDKKLGAARCLDIFHNTSDDDLDAALNYSVGLFYEPTNFYTSRGRKLGAKLGSRDFGVAIEAPADGASPGVLLVLAHERSENKPSFIMGKDKKLLTFGHMLNVKAGQKSALLHWVVQKDFKGGDDLDEQFAPFYAGRQLVAPAVSDDHLELVANFPANYDDFRGGDAYLVAVNQLIDRLQLERMADVDQLRVENGSVLKGNASGSALQIASRFGELEVPVADVAVLQGGGGVGREHRIFLRNGSVYAGEVRIEGLGLKGGFDVSLEVPQLDYLLYRLGASDGEFPEGSEVFVSLHSGDIVPVAASDGTSLSLVSPWGKIEVPIAEVQWLRYVKEPSPRYRISLNDGSLMTVFLDPGTIKFQAGSLGEQSFPATEIAAMWGAEVELPRGFGELVDVSEITSIPKTMTGGVCLLSGSNLVVGSLAGTEINVLTGATVTKVKLADVVRMARSEDADDVAPIYEIELSGGDKLTGMLQERSLDLKSGGKLWRVPVQHFLAMRSEGAVVEGEEEAEEKAETKNEASKKPRARRVVVPPTG